MAFLRQQKIRFGHCDPAGIVFYPRYFEMMNATVEDWFETRLGHSFATIHGPMGSSVPTAALETRFIAPSRLGEMLEITLQLVRLGRTSVQLSLRAACGGAARVEMTQTLVHIDASDGRPRPWPEALRRALEAEESPA